MIWHDRFSTLNLYIFLNKTLSYSCIHIQSSFCFRVLIKKLFHSWSVRTIIYQSSTAIYNCAKQINIPEMLLNYVTFNEKEVKPPKIIIRFKSSQRRSSQDYHILRIYFAKEWAKLFIINVLKKKKKSPNPFKRFHDRKRERQKVLHFPLRLSQSSGKIIQAFPNFWKIGFFFRKETSLIAKGKKKREELWLLMIFWGKIYLIMFQRIKKTTWKFTRKVHITRKNYVNNQSPFY